MASDAQFRIGVIGGTAVAVLAISYLRFCGSVSLPAKPPPPTGPSGTQTQLLSKTTESPQIYAGFLKSDADSAGVRPPSVAEMSRMLPYHVDEARHVLELGAPPIELAGLRLHVERAADQVVLVAENTLDSPVAYEVKSAPSSPGYSCTSGTPLPHNGMVIGKGATERRTECQWYEGLAIIVSRVETLEVPPLSVWYLSEVPPALVGVEERVARGHRGVATSEPCSAVLSSVVRGGIERGDIGWRDLADFYARHRCQSYQFPAKYRAFKADGEQALPAVEASR